MNFQEAKWNKTIFMRWFPACEWPRRTPLLLTSGSAMGNVEIDSISPTGCGSRRSPMPPTITGHARIRTRTKASANAAGSHQWLVGHLGTAVHRVAHIRFFQDTWPSRGAGLLRKKGNFQSTKPCHSEEVAASRWPTMTPRGNAGSPQVSSHLLGGPGEARAGGALR